MELHETRAVVERCFREEAASCECACPFHLDIRGFLKKMARGRWSAAYRDLSTAIAFPTVAAALCPQPCRSRCQRLSTGDEALNMAELERACLAFNPNAAAADFPLQPKSQSVAIVGAGAAGLACALVLSRKKYRVTVFERASGWGGHLRSHPQFEVFDADFARQFAPQNVDFRFGCEAGEAALAAFDAVYLSTGEGGADFGLLGSWNSENFTSSRPGWFLGGGLCGQSLMESMAAANLLSQLMEAYLQTGRAALVVESRDKCRGHMLAHPGEEPKPMVLPADASAGYTKDEARAEAARCMMCTCDACFAGCEILTHYKKAPHKLAADISGDSHTAPPFSNCEATRQTYSCNLCGCCGDRCPEGVDMSKLFLMSREDRRRQEKWVPGIFDHWLRNLDWNGGEGFCAERGRHEYMFFPGCQLSAVLPEQTLESWRFLREKADVGIVLGCCGAPAVWAGDAPRRERNLSLLQSAWEAMGRPTVITACASCADMLKKQIEGIATVSLYEKLLEYSAPTVPSPYGEAAVFDPCSARHDKSAHAAVMALAERGGCRADALPGANCCGHGGHIRLANPKLYDEIASHRAAESELPYYVYCANCLEVFRSQGKEASHILSAVFGGDDAIPTLRQKRHNAAEVKRLVIKETEGADIMPDASPWDMGEYKFSAESLANMEARLISEDDIREAVWKAETERDYFEDESGLRTACLQREVLTFWADYRVSSGAYEIVSAYCHRMHLDGEAGI